MGTLVGWIRNLLVSKYLTSALRTGMAALAGVLATLGLNIDPVILERWTGDTTIIVGAVVVYSLTQFWSWWDKRSVK